MDLVVGNRGLPGISLTRDRALIRFPSRGSQTSLFAGLLAEEPLARPPSWLPRLHQIRQSVANSVRSHYSRRNLEQIFELQPRGADKLLETLPTVQVGPSRLVEREALVAFLEGVREADDVHSYIQRVHRKLRSLVRADIAPATLSSLPSR